MEPNLTDASELEELTAKNHIRVNDINHQPNPITSRIKEHAFSLCSTKTLKKRLPCLTWIPEYDVSCLAGDCIAGLTVSLLIIPQALAYAFLANLTPNYGLYSSFVGGIVYFFLGSTRELNIGPTAIITLLISQYSSQGGADYVVLLCFMSGVIELFAAIVNLGFFINFVSQPVTSGFTNAAAIAIGSSQLKGLLGLNKLKTQGIVNTWYKICLNIKDAVWQDAVLGISSIAAILVIKFINTRIQNDPRKSRRPIGNLFFYVNIGKNALIVLVSSMIAYSLDNEDQPFTLTGMVEAGIPSPHMPPFSTTIDNKTMTFEENMKEIGIGMAMVPLMAILYDVAVASAFSRGKSFEVTQEIIALSVTNIIGSFFRSMPISACLSRTAVNVTSGVRTPAAGLLTSIIVIIAMAVFTPFFRYIPKSTLAAVIICAVIQMFDYNIVKLLWKNKKIELVHFFVTFFTCLFVGIEWGILLGIAINLVFMLFNLATPRVKVELSTFPQSNYPFVLVSPTTGMLYPSVLHIKTAIMKAGLKEGNGILPVVIDCSPLIEFDYTSSKGLAIAMDVYTKREQPLLFLRMKPNIISMMKSVKKGVTSFDTLEDVENKLYNFAKITHKLQDEVNPELSDQEDY